MTRYVTTRSSTRGGQGTVAGLDLGLIDKTAAGDVTSPGPPNVLVYLADQEITDWSRFRLAEDEGVVVLEFDLSADALALCPGTPGLYLVGEATFDTHHGFVGELSSICEDQEGQPAYAWTGQATDGDAAGALIAAIAQALVEDVPRAEDQGAEPGRGHGAALVGRSKPDDKDYDAQIHETVYGYGKEIGLSEEDRAHLEVVFRLSDEPRVLDAVRGRFLRDSATNSALTCYVDKSFNMWELSSTAGEDEKFWANVGRILTGLAMMRTTKSEWRILDVARMRSDLEKLLTEENPTFVHLAEGYYGDEFNSGICLPSDTGTTFSTLFPESSKHTWKEWAQRLGGLMTSEAYTTLEEARLQAGDEKWYQRLYANLYKLQVLDWSQREPVETYWRKRLGGTIPQRWEPGRKSLAIYVEDDTFSYEVDLDKDGDWDWAKKWIDKYLPDYVTS